MSEPKADVMTLVQLLSRYLRDRPLACDTSEGIARWWLNHELAQDREVLDAALSWMTTHGLIEQVTAADGRVRFRRMQTSETADETIDRLAKLADATRSYGSGWH
ncbi:MAG TPA: hypothetical protein VFS42_00755 [Burkholderiaceae bacterium]|nr:hypothetical protein [Burkholderiaceae bacterium]